jgi:hypothetical protein
MDSTFPQGLHDLKIRVDHCHTTRRFTSDALPSELRQADTERLSRHLRLALSKRVIPGLVWVHLTDLCWQ